MKRPKIMGILNLTPDSFSGDGLGADDALAAAQAMIASGVDVLDVGAESTRPGANPLSADAEWRRLEPFLQLFAQQDWSHRPLLSIDTRHAFAAARALALGADIINDVSGLRCDVMAGMLANSACDIVVMHALTIPADKAVVWPQTVDPIAEILAWKHQICTRAEAYHIDPERLIFDPGIGFGKTPEQSLALMLQASHLVESGGRWLYGHSKKSFMALFDNAAIAERSNLTLAFSAQLAHAGVHYLRVHDIDSHVNMFDRLCT